MRSKGFRPQTSWTSFALPTFLLHLGETDATASSGESISLFPSANSPLILPPKRRAPIVLARRKTT